MFDSLSQAAASAATSTASPFGRPTQPGSGSFADSLRASIDEVAKMQNDASDATTDLVTGRTNDLSGVMTAVERGDLAFKTLLAIKSKLMDAYDEIKAMPM